jgi:glycosyltransferase involved in cell wall biosynthesis
MQTSLLSIIIINYNYARFLKYSIDSALAQDWPNKEVIVVDDCSTDHSREVIGAYGNQVIAVLQAQNGGHGAGMNAGFLRSKGDIVIFLDADDYLYPNALRRISESQSPGAAQYQYRLDLVGADGRILDTYPPKEFHWEDGDVTGALLTRGRYATTVTSGLAFSRSTLSSIMPMDGQAFRQGGDGYLVTTAPFYGSVITIDEILGAYRQHGTNHSQFGTAIGPCVRWRMDHDRMRYAALVSHAQRTGRKPHRDLWQNDPFHLEGRMASLLLSPKEHPESGDTRRAIAKCGLAACHSLPMSQKRREVMMMWWRIVGWGPLPLARSALRWKLQAASRPVIVKRLAKLVRAAVG